MGHYFLDTQYNIVQLLEAGVVSWSSYLKKGFLYNYETIITEETVETNWVFNENVWKHAFNSDLASIFTRLIPCTYI